MIIRTISRFFQGWGRDLPHGCTASPFVLKPGLNQFRNHVIILWRVWYGGHSAASGGVTINNKSYNEWSGSHRNVSFPVLIRLNRRTTCQPGAATQSASSSVWATWPRTQDSQLGGMDRLQTDAHDSRRGRQTWKQTLASHRRVILSASLTATKQENKDLHYYENPFHSRIKATCLSCSQAELLKLLHEKVQKRTMTAPHLSSGVQTGQNQRGLSELRPVAD